MYLCVRVGDDLSEALQLYVVYIRCKNRLQLLFDIHEKALLNYLYLLKSSVFYITHH